MSHWQDVGWKDFDISLTGIFAAATIILLDVSQKWC